MQKKRMNIGVLVALDLTAVVAASLFSWSASAEERHTRAAASLPDEETIGKLEQVVVFTGAMPTGVTVAQDGRIFVNFPRWGDPVPFTAAEIKDGQPVAYPNAEINRYSSYT